MVHTYTVSILEAEAKKPPFQSNPGLHSEFQVTESVLTQNQTIKVSVNLLPCEPQFQIRITSYNLHIPPWKSTQHACLRFFHISYPTEVPDRKTEAQPPTDLLDPANIVVSLTKRF